MGVRWATLKPMPDTQTSAAGKTRASWPLYAGFALVAGFVAAVLGWIFAGDSLAALGIPDPGILTTAGYPFLRGVGWLLVALSVGSFLTSAFFISPASDDLPHARLTVDGVLAARTGSLAALGFGLIELLMVPMALSDVSGQPLSEALKPSSWSIAIGQVSAAQAALASAIIALVFGLVSLGLRSWMWQPVWLVFAILQVAPLGLEGHSASGGDHDYGTNSLLLHLLFAFLWVGGLIGLIAHGRRLGPNLAVGVRRYSTLALVSIIAMALTGIINAAIRVRVEDLFTVAYGRVIVAKFLLTVLLGVFGFAHRQRTIPQLEKKPRLFIRVAVVEVIVMAATMGVAVSLGRTPPPPPRDITLSQMVLDMGYEVTKAPTVTSVWTVWRYDLMFTTFGIVLTGLYLWGLYRLREQGKSWPWWRTFWFLLGSVGLAVSMSSGVGLYMPAQFSMHMVTHMVLSMVIPVFLVIGAPLTLALETIAPGEPGKPGMREWIEAFLHSKSLRFIMHPAANTIQFITIFYLLYITPWYSLMVSEHAGHLIMNWVFLTSGYIYYWEMIGGDPKPVENSVMKRLAWLVFSMPFHLYFGVYLMQLSQILAEDFYSNLNLPYPVDLMHDQNVGGGIAWASGSFPLIVVFGTLFLQWLKEDKEEIEEFDRREEETGIDEMDAYNEMLARMNSGEMDNVSEYHNQRFER